jgi:hypothetical protein
LSPLRVRQRTARPYFRAVGRSSRKEKPDGTRAAKAADRSQETPNDERRAERLFAVPPADGIEGPERHRQQAHHEHEKEELCAQSVHLLSLEPDVL